MESVLLRETEATQDGQVVKTGVEKQHQDILIQRQSGMSSALRGTEMSNAKSG